MDKIAQIQWAIAHAEREESKLGHATFDIGGFTSPKIRHLMNNLGSISSRYFEIGLLHGSLHAATLYKNDHLNAIGCDNFSEFDGSSDNLVNNLERYGLKSTLFTCDCWELDPLILSPMRINDEDKYIDLYFFDGPHDYESQKRAITHFLPAMANEFILVVDDFDWKDVVNGTMDGIAESGLKILFDKEFLVNTGFHNGLYVALLKKVS